MIDPATTDALRAIASMMRMEGYRTDATGVEALVLDNAAAEIEKMQKVLSFAAGYISTYPGHSHQHPEEILKWLKSAALEGK